MARYIDADKLKEMIEAKADTLIAGKEAFLYIAKWLDLLPPADVVPKSRADLYRKQVDELEDELASTYDKLEDAKSEVEKIFAEIESKIIAEIDRNNGVLVEFEDADELYHRIKGEVYALCEIQDFSAELKKKYTEGQK